MLLSLLMLLCFFLFFQCSLSVVGWTLFMICVEQLDNLIVDHVAGHKTHQVKITAMTKLQSKKPISLAMLSLLLSLLLR